MTTKNDNDKTRTMMNDYDDENNDDYKDIMDLSCIKGHQSDC